MPSNFIRPALWYQYGAYSPLSPDNLGADNAQWLQANSSRIVLALNLVPFAGIAFLWFIGVLRDRK